MIDALDVIAFVVFGVLLAVFVIIVVTVGQLPGRIAQKRGHPQATAIKVAGWLGVAILVLWPLALVWAFLKPISAVPSGSAENQQPRRPFSSRLECVTGTNTQPFEELDPDA